MKVKPLLGQRSQGLGSRNLMSGEPGASTISTRGVRLLTKGDHAMVRIRRLLAVGAAAALVGSVLAAGGGLPAQAASPSQNIHITCEYSRVCPDLSDNANVFQRQCLRPLRRSDR